MRSNPLILIADDDLGFLEIVCTALKRNGFLVAEAHDGTEAVQKAVNLHPDLILMDINMPGEGGTEAILDLKKNPESKDIKVIFLTSETEPWPAFKKGKDEASEVAKELGATEFLNKTKDLDKIIEKVKESLK